LFESVVLMQFLCLFFFSSRRRHTRFSRDWSSDVCSSDLNPLILFRVGEVHRTSSARVIRSGELIGVVLPYSLLRGQHSATGVERSEERRVGKECGSRWSPYYQKVINNAVYTRSHCVCIAV